LSTVNEFGLSGIDVTAWYAVYAPSGTPSEIVNLLQGAINKGIKDGPAKEKLLKLNATVVGSTPDVLTRHMNQELARWAKIIKLSNIQPD
jgi:tripartite-type tricarboxylate transporter receptor subunit TctC